MPTERILLLVELDSPHIVLGGRKPFATGLATQVQEMLEGGDSLVRVKVLDHIVTREEVVEI